MRKFYFTDILIRTLGELSLALLVACTPDQISVIKSESDAEAQTEIEVLLENPERIGFAEVSRLAFGDSCQSCHNSQVSGGEVNLENYETLMDSRVPNLVMLGEPMESRLFTSLEVDQGARKMPPDPDKNLSENQKKIVYEWIARGAPKQAGERRAFLSLEEKLTPFFENPETIDYQVVRQWVFEPGGCYDCHSRKGYRADPSAILFGADMSRYPNLFLYNAVVKGQPANRHNPAGQIKRLGSQIFEAVAMEKSMPPAVDGYFPLSELRVKLLRLWILNCAIEEYDSVQSETLVTNRNQPEKIRNCY